MTFLEDMGIIAGQRWTERQDLQMRQRVRGRSMLADDPRNVLLRDRGLPPLDQFAITSRHRETLPELHKCPVCDWHCEEKWRMQVHTDLNPRWCQERGRKKAKAWGDQT